MTLRKDWLREQYEKAIADIERWPDWMRRQSGLIETPSKGTEREPRDGSEETFETKRPSRESTHG